jgi:hypothetical protein
MDRITGHIRMGADIVSPPKNTLKKTITITQKMVSVSAGRG